MIGTRPRHDRHNATKGSVAQGGRSPQDHVKKERERKGKIKTTLKKRKRKERKQFRQHIA